MSDDERIYRERQRGRAACTLALAAKNLRDADDALVMFGRTQVGVTMPDDSDGEKAHECCQAVELAHAQMRHAEDNYLAAVLAARRP